MEARRVGDAKPKKGWVPKGWAPKDWGPEGLEPRKVGSAQNFAFFSSPAAIFHCFFSLSLGSLPMELPQTVLTDERKRHVRDQEKDQTGVILCQACSSRLFCRQPSKKTCHVGKRKRGMGICLGDNDHDCLTNMRFADGVLLFASSKKQLSKMLCDFKRSTEKLGLRIHPGKTKILSNQSSNSRKEIEIDNIKVEMLTREESTK